MKFIQRFIGCMKPYYSVKLTKFPNEFSVFTRHQRFFFFLHVVHSTVSSSSPELSFRCTLMYLLCAAAALMRPTTTRNLIKSLSCAPGIPQQTIFKIDLFTAHTKRRRAKEKFRLIEHRLYRLKCCFSHTFFSSSLGGMFEIGNDIRTT